MQRGRDRMELHWLRIGGRCELGGGGGVGGQVWVGWSRLACMGWGVGRVHDCLGPGEAGVAGRVRKYRRGSNGSGGHLPRSNLDDSEEGCRPRNGEDDILDPPAK